MHDIFRNGGLGAYPTALLGLVLIAIAVRYAVKPEQRWIPLQIALGITTLAVGAASFVAGVIATLNAVGTEASQGLANVGEAASRAGLIGAVGIGESLNNLAIALCLVAIAALATTVGVARKTSEAHA